MVRRLITGSLIHEGKFQIIWDGKDGFGNLLPGGIYFYSLKGEQSGERKGKIILTR